MRAGSAVLGVAFIGVVALVAAVLGFRSAWRGMGKLRAPAGVDGALLSWDERPVPAFRQDPVVASFLGAHNLAVVAIAALAALNGARALGTPLGWLPAAEARARAGSAGGHERRAR
jgi:hypothetical protein